VFILALSNWLLLAQEAGAGDAAADATAPAQQQPPGFSSMLPALVGIMALFYFLILRPQKAKEQQFRSMVDALKEKDRVVTIGGIHGVVTNVQREAGVITVRIDESTGTKIRVNASAIAKVVTDEESAETTKAT
jgi:preprotein translocase subunit YajC